MPVDSLHLDWYSWHTVLHQLHRSTAVVCMLSVQVDDVVELSREQAGIDRLGT